MICRSIRGVVLLAIDFQLLHLRFSLPLSDKRFCKRLLPIINRDERWIRVFICDRPNMLFISCLNSARVDIILTAVAVSKIYVRLPLCRRARHLLQRFKHRIGVWQRVPAGRPTVAWAASSRSITSFHYNVMSLQRHLTTTSWHSVIGTPQNLRRLRVSAAHRRRQCHVTFDADQITDGHCN